MNNLIRIACLASIAASAVGCSDSATTTTSASSAYSGSYPTGLAISSPVAGSTTTAFQIQDMNQNDPFEQHQAAAFNSALSYKDKISKIDAILSGKSVADCQVSLPSVTGSTSPTCYGPTLNYVNHPGGGSSPASLPSGDLGIWTSSDASGEACAATKLNQLVKDIAAKQDTALLLSASMICLLNVKGTALPNAGDAAIDLTSDMNTAVSANNASATITAATFQRLADSGSNPVYQISIAGTNTVNATTVSMTFGMTHIPTTSTNSTYKGRIWGSLTGLPNMGDARQVNAFFSLGYERTAAKILAEVQFAGTASSITSGLNTNGTLNWSTIMASSGSNAANLQHVMLSMDPSTGTGSASYAWQAGGGDDSTRVFNAYSTSTNGALSGCGFFGFGSSFSTSGAPNNTINKFICNWAGPGNNHTGLVGHSQKQCMTKNTTTGLFTSIAAKESITYAPVNLCAVPSGGTFAYGLTATQDGTWVDTATTAVTDNLIDLSIDTDFAAYTAPATPATL